MYKASKQEGLMLWLFAFCLTTFTLSGIVLNPGHQMPELGADGGKNLFTFLYHAMYGKGYWFTGMNYPAGEHIVYTDGQPIISVLLGYLPVRLGLNAALSVMWWLVAFSWMLGIIFCYRILRMFAVRGLLAGLFSGLIIVLSPQMLRISGHYALSWVCFIPMLFYFTLCYNRSSGLKYLALIFTTGIAATFLHPYFAALFMVWAGTYSAGYLLISRLAWARRLLHIAGLLGATVAIMAAFGIVIKLTDPFKDRPVLPYGFLNNCTHFKDIISSVYSPFWAVLSGSGPGRHISSGGEGYVYMGLTVLLALGYTVVLFVTGKRRQLPFNGQEAFSPVWLIMAVLALLAGMGAPFTWRMEWLLNYMSFLRQFRTLGRFSWISYYIFAVYAAVFVTRYYEQLKAGGRQKPALLFLTLCLFIWEIEAWGYVTHIHKVTAKGAANYKEFASEGNTWTNYLGQHKYKAADFQAVMVLPFFENGSEKLWVCSDENVSAWGVREGIRAGLQLHLPIMDGMMSRTSWQVAFSQVRLAGGPYARKDVLKRLGTKPILLLCLASEKLNPDQQYLLTAADSLGRYGYCNVYALYPARLLAGDSAAIALATVVNTHNDTAISNTGPWAVHHFTSAGNCLKGKPYSPTDSILAGFVLSPLSKATLYEFSAWFRVSSKDYYTPDVTLYVLDSLGKPLLNITAVTRESTDNNGLWLRCNAWFTLPAGSRTVRCTRQYPEIRSYEEVGDMMLRPDSSVISTHNGSCLNNHWVGYK